MKKIILLSILSLMIFSACKEDELPEPEDNQECIISQIENYLISHSSELEIWDESHKYYGGHYYDATYDYFGGYKSSFKISFTNNKISYIEIQKICKLFNIREIQKGNNDRWYVYYTDTYIPCDCNIEIRANKYPYIEQYMYAKQSITIEIKCNSHYHKNYKLK